jgi:hypothetical protein
MRILLLGKAWLVVSYTGSFLMLLSFCYTFFDSLDQWMFLGPLLTFLGCLSWVAALRIYGKGGLWQASNTLTDYRSNAPWIIRAIEVVLWVTFYLGLPVIAYCMALDCVTLSRHYPVWFKREFILAGSGMFWSAGALIHGWLRTKV